MHSVEPSDDPRVALVEAVKSNNVARARELFERHPELKSTLNEPMPELPFDGILIGQATWSQNREMVDLLLQAGADINGRSRWWAGGFGVLDGCDPEFAPFLIERGATVDAHAAARLGRVQALEALLSNNPDLVHARGGDGQTPLHFASTVEIARLLLDRGADIDARDVDHEGTPAQYQVRDRQDVARFLVSHGCRTDLLLAAALGDIELVRRHLDADPACVRTTVSGEYFPMQDPRAGGHIYIWTLGGNKTAHVVAREFGHEEIVRLLMERSPDELKLAEACELGDEVLFDALLKSRPDLARTLSPGERRKIVGAAECNNTEVVRLMLLAGWPVDVRGSHGGTPLHFAAWSGNAPMVREILRYDPPVDARDNDFNGTPIGWALHGSENSGRKDKGAYAGVVEALVQAGAIAPKVTDDLEASEAVRAVLRRYLADSS